MNCREAQSLIVPFIEDKLDDEQLEAFLAHIESCSECYDELEVYFIVFSGTRQLDDNYDEISDFKGELTKYIERKKEKYHKKHKRELWARASVVAIMCAAAMFIIFITMYNAAGRSVSVMVQRAISAVTGDFDAEAVKKMPRNNVCTYLLNDDGEISVKIIRKQEEKQNERKDSSD